MAETLFDRVVAASGLSPVFGRSAIERACMRVQVVTAELTPATLATALDSIRRALAVFLKPAELEQRMAAITLLTRT